MRPHAHPPLALALLLLAACTTAPSPRPAPPPDPARDAQAIRAFYGRWFGAMESGDVEGLLALLADPFLLKGPGQPPVADRETLRRGLERFHAAASEEVEYRVEEFQVAGPWAWVRVTERATITPRGGGEARVLTGTHLGILVRQPDGSWRLARDVSSLDHPH